MIPASMIFVAAMASIVIVEVTTVSYGKASVETAQIETFRYTAGVLSYTKQGDGIFKNSFE